MVSMEDQLMRVFGGDRMKALMGTFGIPEDEPIQNGLISRQLESAQSRIEGFHFDARKQVLAYDNVQNQQRKAVYERRVKLLKKDRAEIAAVLNEITALAPELDAVIKAKEAEFGTDVWTEMVQKLTLQMIDILWVEHLEVMQYTRSSVNLRAYGQKDPLLEYRKEGSRLFKEMQQAVLERMADILPQLQPQALEAEEVALRKERVAAQEVGNGAKASGEKQAPRTSDVMVGRNEMVTITNGSETQTLKYKKAEPLLAEGWTVVK
jgi:preprotein translocase subunit SecA